MITHPLPGATKFQSRLPDDQARKIAHYYYDVVDVVRLDDSHGVKTIGGFAAQIGLIDGTAMILHKNPDGSRTLQPAVS